MSKIIVSILNKIPIINGYKTSIGVAGLCLTYFLTDFGVITAEQCAFWYKFFGSWTTVALYHSQAKNKG